MRPVVYISLGTVVKGTAVFFQSCLEAFRNENADVILSVGKQFPIKKLRNIPSNIQVYATVPQMEVLKITDVFITHGGMNSVSEALFCETPMVVIPFISDQPVNARCVEKLGVGKYLEYSDVDKDTLKDAVRTVLTDSDIKENLAKASKWIQKAPGNAGGAEMILEFVSEWKYRKRG